MLNCDESEILDSLEKLNCGYEGGPIDGLYSVNVPPFIDKVALEKILNKFEEDGWASMAYPAWRNP